METAPRLYTAKGYKPNKAGISYCSALAWDEMRALFDAWLASEPITVATILEPSEIIMFDEEYIGSKNLIDTLKNIYAEIEVDELHEDEMPLFLTCRVLRSALLELRRLSPMVETLRESFVGSFDCLRAAFEGWYCSPIKMGPAITSFLYPASKIGAACREQVFLSFNEGLLDETVDSCKSAIYKASSGFPGTQCASPFILGSLTRMIDALTQLRLILPTILTLLESIEAHRMIGRIQLYSLVDLVEYETKIYEFNPPA